MLLGMIELQPSMRCREPTHPVPAPGTNPNATLALQAQMSATPSRRWGTIVLSSPGKRVSPISHLGGHWWRTRNTRYLTI